MALLAFSTISPRATLPARAAAPGQQPDQKQSDRQPQQGQQGQKDQPANQNQDQKKTVPKTNDDKDSGDWSSSSSSSAASAKQPAEDLPKYNPLPAEQDVDVGTFYMHKGDADAAIARFQDAIQLKADYAKPRLLLAELYEKKGDKGMAVKYYKEYLQVYPHAPDAKKIQTKIDKLSVR